MSRRVIVRAAAPVCAAAVVLLVLALPARPHAAAPAPQRGGPGGRGRGFAPPPPGRPGAPIDMTGNWVSVVTEDWMSRMMTAPKGDFSGVPLNAAGVAAANAWNPSEDGSCKAFGVGGIMRMPERLKISWQDDLTLKIETDAGEQMRLLHFLPPNGKPSPGARSAQGYSVAEWERPGGQRDAFLSRGVSGVQTNRGSLKVVTTDMTPGWLRRNGVPYGQSATVTEYFTRFTNPDAGDWFVVTTVVDDPEYLTQPFITSSNFKKEANDAKWDPKPCKG